MKLSVFLLAVLFAGFVQAQKGSRRGVIPARMHGSRDSLLTKSVPLLTLPDSCVRQGLVFIEFLLKNNGDKENVHVVRELCQYADSVAIKIAEEVKFSPRIVRGVSADSKQIMSIPFVTPNGPVFRMDGPGSRPFTNADSSILYIWKVHGKQFEYYNRFSKEGTAAQLIDLTWVEDFSLERNLIEVQKRAPYWIEGIIEVEFKEEVWKEMPRKLKRQFRKQR